MPVPEYHLAPLSLSELEALQEALVFTFNNHKSMRIRAYVNNMIGRLNSTLRHGPDKPAIRIQRDENSYDKEGRFIDTGMWTD
jgi:hypothetical protein